MRPLAGAFTGISITTSGDVVANYNNGQTKTIGEVPLERLIHAIPAFPTRSEVWLKLLADWDF